MKYHRRSVNFQAITRARDNYYQANPHKSLCNANIERNNKISRLQRILYKVERYAWGKSCYWNRPRISVYYWFFDKLGSIIRKLRLYVASRNFYKTFGKD